ncbi:efflux RND transporter periplasmic adaptor subunit [Thalassotalea sp. LPB0316]|uniref:efflux RND transporter periplasmic adaptor subunit n=1 Tax=Thalassotalea sp. LPB0316 TaxID=2769490 RepID=UPI001868281D|nr:efflux RND transporter periplasmic adaptor subunit [Thalassotalea sp. LPB0316]QOL26779.1 efflux RND transporter periplasmic adaptor subunit [Thalassotalea sp. LPB0316]
MTPPVTSPTEQTKPEKQRKMVQLRFVLWPIAIIVAAIVLLGVMGALAPKPEKKPFTVKAPLVEVQDITSSDVQFVIASQGSVLPRTETVIVSEVSGQVVSVSDKFIAGGFFKKGEQLLSINDIDYQVALLQAKARLHVAEAALMEEKARVEQAKEEWGLTGKSLSDAPALALRKPQLQKAKADLEAAQADVQAAQIKLERTKIVAPYDAMLKTKHLDIGQFVGVGGQIATTFAVDYAEIRLPVKFQDIDFLSLPKINNTDALQGSRVDLHIDVLGQQQTWQAQLARYEGVVDMNSRVHYVVAQVDDPYNLFSENRPYELRVGTFVNGDIYGKTVTDITAIPRAAVRGANSVHLVTSKNTLDVREIDILRGDANYVYTRDKFAPDERLILTKLELPVNGMDLRVVNDQSPTGIEQDSAQTDVNNNVSVNGETND